MNTSKLFVLLGNVMLCAIINLNTSDLIEYNQLARGILRFFEVWKQNLLGNLKSYM